MNYNPNRKYTTIQMPNTAHPTRFKTLGENYTEQAIKDRILANRAPSRPLFKPPQIRFYDFSVHSLRGLYVHYCHQLGFIQKNNSYPHYSASLRAEIRKLDEYSAQAILLCKNKIDTAEQLRAFINNTQS